jgi:hypothetical protein
MFDLQVGANIMSERFTETSPAASNATHSAPGLSRL